MVSLKGKTEPLWKWLDRCYNTRTCQRIYGWKLLAQQYTPTKVVLNMMSYEAWFNRKPTVDYFKVFGCVAYSHIPKEN